MDTRCQMCFKVKLLVPAMEGLAVQVCKGCFYEIDRVVGFIEMARAQAEGAQTTMRDLGSDLTPLPPIQSENGRQPASGRGRPRKLPLQS